MRAALCCLLAGLLPCTGLADEPGETPSIELLEYLAEFIEDANGHLMDPLDDGSASATPPPAGKPGEMSP